MKKFILYKVLLLDYVNRRNRTHCSISSSNEDGISILETIVSLLIGSIILVAALGGLVSFRQLVVRDRTESDVNQRLRTAFNSIGPDLQQTGEGLIAQPEFPALLVTQSNVPSSSDTTSEITIRKGDLVGEISVCADITAGSTLINVANDPPLPPVPPTASCALSTDGNNDGWPDDIRQWQGKRIDEGGSITGFIFDSATGNGEFFTYVGEETLNASNAGMTPAPGTPPVIINVTSGSGLANAYTAGSTVIYLLEERKYLVDLSTNKMQLIVNDTETFDLVENINLLDVTVNLQQSLGGTVYACKEIPPVNSGSCSPAYPNPADYTWNQISSIELNIVAQPPDNAPVGTANNLSIDDLSSSQEYFPRNRLSF